jgi:2-dehydropantoate 2-reductase
LNHERADEERNSFLRSVAVLGPGGVGGFLAAALARGGLAPASGAHAAQPTPTVTVIAREETARLIMRDGIAVSSAVLGEFVARPRAATTLDEPVDVLFVTTKAPVLERALQRVRATPGLVVPLLNGVEHMDELRRRFGAAHVAAGAIRIESERISRRSPPAVAQTSPQVSVELAADDLEAARKVPAVIQLLTKAGIPASIGRSEEQVLWSKLVRLCALSATTAAFDQPLGAIRREPVWRDALVRCVREGAAVANAEGALVDAEATLAELRAAHDTLRSSMQRDIAAGRDTELDSIQGAVLRAAARLGIPCPTIRALTARIARRAGTLRAEA